jgi:outer membrane receptor for ferrienterochelin and colicins
MIQCNYTKCVLLTFSLLVFPLYADADAHLPTSRAAATGSAGDEVLNYPYSFFQRYQPNTALDMINVLPGFQLDAGEDKRGLGEAAGNVLINDRRPSAKQDLVTTILSRIPAGNVENIEIIREQVRGIDLGGYSIVANVRLREGSEASVRWEVYAEKNLEPKPLGPGGSISMSNRWQAIDYNLGFETRRIIFGDVGTDELFDSQRSLTERRDDDLLTKGLEYYINLNASTEINETLLQTNIKFGSFVTDGDLVSMRIPQTGFGPQRNERFLDELDTKQFEMGVDAERNLSNDLNGKAILLFTRKRDDEVSTQRTLNVLGTQTAIRSALSEKISKEIIGRLEMDWIGVPDHTLQVNLEGAFNSLDGSLEQTEDIGAGLVNVPLPGANTRVEEIRGDFEVKDNWNIGSFELTYGIGLEISTITQTGDAELERTFTFLKPEALLSYSANSNLQYRLRIAREVSQLNFDDFVSATVFEDNDLALGNPDLKPEATWVTELSHERRFGEYTVITLRAFHNWISDVEDLLPLTDTFEAPGNIGSGRRWGLEFEGTLPLDWLRLTGARLDIKARWQDSTVTDPVTGEARVLSSKQTFVPPGDFSYLRNENKFAFTTDFRQDFEVSRVSWGWSFNTRTQRPFFRVNEFEALNEGIDVSTFIETTRWLGIKIRFEVNRAIQVFETRDRTLYTGRRDLSAIDSYAERQRDGGRELVLRLSGTF